MYRYEVSPLSVWETVLSSSQQKQKGIPDWTRGWLDRNYKEGSPKRGLLVKNEILVIYDYYICSREMKSVARDRRVARAYVLFYKI